MKTLKDRYSDAVYNKYLFCSVCGSVKHTEPIYVEYVNHFKWLLH